MEFKKTIYGLHQSARAFWKYLTKKLELCGLNQSEFNPFLFVKEKVVLIVYVGDPIFWVRHEDYIHDPAMEF